MISDSERVCVCVYLCEACWYAKRQSVYPKPEGLWPYAHTNTRTNSEWMEEVSREVVRLFRAVGEYTEYIW